MTKQLLRQITFMCLFVMLGTFNLAASLYTSIIWLYIFDGIAAVLCFITAWRVYRKACEVAKVLDLRREDLEQRILTLHFDVLALEKATFSTENENEKNDDHEDTGAPV